MVSRMWILGLVLVALLSCHNAGSAFVTAETGPKQLVLNMLLEPRIETPTSSKMLAFSGSMSSSMADELDVAHTIHACFQYLRKHVASRGVGETRPTHCDSQFLSRVMSYDSSSSSGQHGLEDSHPEVDQAQAEDWYWEALEPADDQMAVAEPSIPDCNQHTSPALGGECCHSFFKAAIISTPCFPFIWSLATSLPVPPLLSIIARGTNVVLRCPIFLIFCMMVFMFWITLRVKELENAPLVGPPPSPLPQRCEGLRFELPPPPKRFSSFPKVDPDMSYDEYFSRTINRTPGCIWFAGQFLVPAAYQDFYDEY